MTVAPAEMVANASKSAAAKPAAAKPGGSAAPGLLPLVDGTVQRKDGSKVGRVVDVLIDAAAQPLALVLDVNNSSIAIGQDVHNIAANWSALSFVTKGQAMHVQMDLSAAQIKVAPPYAADKPILAVSPAAAPAAAAGAASAVPASSTRSPR